MHSRTFADLDRIVALGDGRDLGRVMSSLPSLDSRLTGIVTTADNGGSTRRIRHSEGGIAQDDMCNCINQLIVRPNMVPAMLEYCSSGNGELFGHNLGNLMLRTLDHLSMRPLEAIDSIRNLFKVDVFLIPMSEQPVDLIALDHEGHEAYDEMSIDQLGNLPQEPILTPPVSVTREAMEMVAKADLILIDPGSLYTSLLPVLLLDEMAQAPRRTPAPMAFIDNLGKEHSPAARLSLAECIVIMERYADKRMVDAVTAGPKANIYGTNDWLVIRVLLEASNVPYRHDRALLRGVLEKATQLPG